MAITENIKAIIINLDDTLCLTEQVSYEMENETLHQLGRPAMPRDIHKSTWGKPLFEIISTRSPGVDIDAFRECYIPIIAKYVNQRKLDTIAPENLEVLDKLISDGMILFILTSRTHTEVAHLLEPDHDLATRITMFYYRDNTRFHKPDPRAFDLLMEENGLLPSDCIYVGDSLSDAEAAKKAGLYFIASLESGLRTREDFIEHPVDYFVDSFTEINIAVQKLKVTINI